MNVRTVKCLCSTRGGGEAKVQVRVGRCVPAACPDCTLMRRRVSHSICSEVLCFTRSCFSQKPPPARSDITALVLFLQDHN